MSYSELDMYYYWWLLRGFVTIWLVPLFLCAILSGKGFYIDAATYYIYHFDTSVEFVSLVQTSLRMPYEHTHFTIAFCLCLPGYNVCLGYI